jgi:hypothetical protein
MPDPSRDTAAAMLQAVRWAELSSQPLAVGLADALEELVGRESDHSHPRTCVISCDSIEEIINHLRTDNHA